MKMAKIFIVLLIGLAGLRGASLAVGAQEDKQESQLPGKKS